MLLATVLGFNNIMQCTETKQLPSPVTCLSIVPTAPHMPGTPEASRGLLGKCHIVTQNFGTFHMGICNSICCAVVFPLQ